MSTRSNSLSPARAGTSSALVGTPSGAGSVRVHQIEEQFGRLEAVIDQAYTAAERLLDRVKAVSLPETPASASGQCPQPPLVPVAEVLAHQVERLAALASRLNDAADRVEL